MKNFLVFLVKTAILFVLFWLLNKLFAGSTTLSNWPSWTIWLVMAAAASLFDMIVDVFVDPSSKFGNYAIYKQRVRKV